MMTAFHYNLGLMPIPPVPHFPDPVRNTRTRDSYQTAAMIAARQQMATRQAAHVAARRATAFAFISLHKSASTKEISEKLKWSKAKVYVAFAHLANEGIVRNTGGSSQARWELIDGSD